MEERSTEPARPRKSRWGFMVVKGWFEKGELLARFPGYGSLHPGLSVFQETFQIAIARPLSASEGRFPWIFDL